MSTSVVITSKSNAHFKRRVVLSHNPTVIKDAKNKEQIYFKVDDGKLKWSKDSKVYYSRLKNCPFDVEEKIYPHVKMLSLNELPSSKYGYEYFLIDKNTQKIICSKFSKKPLSFNEKTGTKFFDKIVNHYVHDIKATPLTEHPTFSVEKDPYGNDYISLIKDERVKKTTAVLLILWLIFNIVTYFTPQTKKEVTVLQVKNKDKILQQREKVLSLLTTTKGPDKINQKTVKKSTKVISKTVAKSSSQSSPKRAKTKKVAKASSVKPKAKKAVKKSKTNVAANAQNIKKPSKAPSLQDQLFARSLKKGSLGKASKTASNTLRGSSSGSDKGKNYGSSSKVSGGFDTGKGSSLGAMVSGRSGVEKGSGLGSGGNGVGSLGSHVMLSGDDANVSGGLTREQISKVVRRHKKDINQCYESRLQFSPSLAGNVTMKFSINATGRVTYSNPKSSSVKDAALESCIANKIKNWRFDKPDNGRTVIVSYPFNLSLNKGSI